MSLNTLLPVQNSPRQNLLFAALPPADYERLLPHLELVPLVLGQVLYESGDQQHYAYFLTTSIVSKVYPLGDTLSQELAIVGNCGVVGYVLFTGGESATHRAVVLSAGYAYKLRADVLKTEFERGGALHQQLLLYTQALIVQISQTVACSQCHTIDQQLCRWLAPEPGPAAHERTDPDTGTDRRHAGGTPRGRGCSRRPPARGGIDKIQPHQDHRTRSA